MNKTIRILLTCYSAAACSMSLLGMQEPLQTSNSIIDIVKELDNKLIRQELLNEEIIANIQTIYIKAQNRDDDIQRLSARIAKLEEKIDYVLNELSELYKYSEYENSESYENFENENSDFIQPPKVRSFGDREYKGNLPHSESIKEDKEGEDSSITAFNPSQEVSSDSTDEIIRLKHKSCKF